MKSFILKLANRIYVWVSALLSHIRLRPVLTKTEARSISNEKNRDLVFNLCDELQREIETAAKQGAYTTLISGKYPLDVFSAASKVFLARGFSVQVCRSAKQHKETNETVYYLKVSWAMKEKHAR